MEEGKRKNGRKGKEKKVWIEWGGAEKKEWRDGSEVAIQMPTAAVSGRSAGLICLREPGHGITC